MKKIINSYHTNNKINMWKATQVISKGGTILIGTNFFNDYILEIFFFSFALKKELR